MRNVKLQFLVSKVILLTMPGFDPPLAEESANALTLYQTNGWVSFLVIFNYGKNLANWRIQKYSLKSGGHPGNWKLKPIRP